MKTLQRTTLLLAGLVASAGSYAAATPVGTEIKNEATATYYAPSDATKQLSVSDSTLFIVQEKIDVTVERNTNTSSSVIDVQAGSTQVIEYRINNTGNGNETFNLAVNNLSGDSFDVSNVKIYLDDGVDGFQGTETEVSVTNLDADSSKTFLVVVTVPASQSISDTSDFNFTVTSATPGAAGATAGTVLDKQGDGGTDAVLATNNGSVIDLVKFNVSATAGLVVISKTVLSYEHPTLGNVKVPGTVVTYQILVQVTDAVNGLNVVDDLPVNLTYNEGSLLLANSNLAGTPLTTANASANTDSAADADAGRYDQNAGDNGRVTFVLGDQAAAGNYTIQFQATID